ncbi:MAG: FMN-dependent NADH-azoreductase [Deferrisomatales bacterium]
MAKLLHIQASPMGELSFSARAARAFLDAYRARNPGDSVETLELATADLPAFDFSAASGKYKIMRGLAHSAEEARAWSRVTQAVAQLKAADKVVVSTGMWNFSIPYRLKQWVDIIVQPGLTFSFDPATGYTGLVTGRPVQLLLASGGEYAAGTPAAAYDHQKPYLELIFGFIGFTDVRTLRVEGTLSPAADANLAVVLKAAAEAARVF